MADKVRYWLNTIHDKDLSCVNSALSRTRWRVSTWPTRWDIGYIPYTVEIFLVSLSFIRKGDNNIQKEELKIKNKR